MRIAVLEDDVSQLEYLVHTIEHKLLLIDETVSCVGFEREDELRRVLRYETFDLLLLNWNVPTFDGVDLLHWLRRNQQSDVPVIMISIRTSQDDIASAFGMGADDYIVKPVRPMELIARVRRLLLRNLPNLPKPVEHFDNWTFDRASLSARWENGDEMQRFDLTEHEFRLALALFRRLGHVVSRAYLRESMGHDGELSTRTLDTQICRLRRKLCLYAIRGVRLQTIYGRGYRLERLEN